MKPIRTPRANTLYTGSDNVGELYTERRQEGDTIVVESVWHATDAERQAIAAGANILLRIHGVSVPPIALEVTDQVGEDEDAPDVLRRLEQLRGGGT